MQTHTTLIGLPALCLLLAQAGFAVSVNVQPTQNGGPSPAITGTLGPAGGVLTTPLPSLRPGFAPGALTLTASPAVLLSSRDLAFYIQQAVYDPQHTDITGAVIVRQFSVDDFLDQFDGPLQLDVTFPAADVAPLDQSKIDLFIYDVAAGVWRSQHAIKRGNTLSTLLPGKAMIGIGGPLRPGRRALGFPMLPGRAVLGWALASGALSVCCWALFPGGIRSRRRMLPASVALGLALCCISFSTPEVTGNPPVAVNNMRVTSVTNQQLVNLQTGQVVPGKKVVYEVERYKGAGDKKDPQNWDKAANTEYFPDSIGTAAFAGATRQAEALSAQLAYDCAGFVFRNKSFIPLDPDKDARAILDHEYRTLTKDEQPQVGDVIIYKKDNKITHYAIVTKVEGGRVTEVESKWGRSPRYKHPPDVVPDGYGDKTGDTYRKKQ